MIYFQTGSPETVLSDADLRAGLFQALEATALHHSASSFAKATADRSRREGDTGSEPWKKVLILPPDGTRPHAHAGELTQFAKEVSDNAVDYAWPVRVNRLLVEGGFDLILSIGQVVPHEVVGMASHSKNIFVGTGGADGTHKIHFLGAAYGMEKMMGHADAPVRGLFVGDDAECFEAAAALSRRRILHRRKRRTL